MKSFRSIWSIGIEVIFGIKPGKKPGSKEYVIVSYKLLKWYIVLVTMMGFACFMLEESMQTRGFGRFILTSGKMWAEAGDMCNTSMSMLEKEKGFMKLNSYINPFFGWVYFRYAQSEEMKLMAEMKRIEMEISRINGRLEIVENRLQVKPIDLTPEKGGELQSLEGIDLTQDEIRPVRQIDYETHPERVEAAIKAKTTGYVATQFGQKYHRPGCRTVKNKLTIELTAEDIAKRNLTPCMICRPDMQKGD